MNLPSAATKPFFYGWVVVTAAFAIMFVSFGSAYTFSAFGDILQKEFGASRGSVSLVFSLAGFLYFGLGVVTGPLADRWGARKLVLIGMLTLALGFALASQARNLLEVYLAYGIGVGVGIGCSYVPAVATVQKWFINRRGFASGLAVSGIGVGTLIMPALAAWLLNAVGWRNTYLIIAAITASVGIAAALTLANHPNDKGLAPDGEPLASPETRTPPAGLSVREAITSQRFIRLYIACLACGFSLFVPFIHLVPYATDHGVSASSAILLVGVIGIGSTLGRFLLGSVADRIGRQNALQSLFIAMAASLVIWFFATGFWSLAFFALIFGMFYGGWVAVLPSVAMDYFGGRNISSIIGVLYTSVAFGTLIGPTAAGYAFDLSGNYTFAIIASIVMNLLAAIVIRGNRTTTSRYRTD
jgi:MFS transporter, OFA family, oxalate/formate antiporter